MLKHGELGATSAKHNKPYERSNGTYTREYRAWADAKARCKSKGSNHKHYGKRGIKMCEEWSNSFLAFLRDMGECPPKHTLDRIRVNEGYQPDNCRWATIAVQRRNCTNSVIITFNGVTKNLMDWGKDYPDIPIRRLFWRAENGVVPPTLFHKGRVFPENKRTVLNKDNGIFYAGLHEAYLSTNGNFSYIEFCYMVSGKYKNRTEFIKLY